jgi:hypothetical protein
MRSVSSPAPGGPASRRKFSLPLQAGCWFTLSKCAPTRLKRVAVAWPARAWGSARCLSCHFIHQKYEICHHIGWRAAQGNGGRAGDLSGGDQRQRIEQLVHRAEAARQHDERLRVLDEDGLADETTPATSASLARPPTRRGTCVAARLRHRAGGRRSARSPDATRRAYPLLLFSLIRTPETAT